MPHLTLEYTANLSDRAPDPALLLQLHRLLESVVGIQIENCKSRWRKAEEWVVGAGQGASAFVHLDIRFLEGRSEDAKRAFGTAAVELLRAHFGPPAEGLDFQITVEVHDIRRTTYFKDPPGTLGPPPLTIV
jgi:5-carboxymethyl-2-hydroxymuconate isomerase